MRFPRAGDSALLSTCPGKYLARGQGWALHAQGVGGCGAVLRAWWVHAATTGRGFTVRVARAPSTAAEMVRGWMGPLKSLAVQTDRKLWVYTKTG